MSFVKWMGMLLAWCGWLCCQPGSASSLFRLAGEPLFGRFFSCRGLTTQPVRFCTREDFNWIVRVTVIIPPNSIIDCYLYVPMTNPQLFIPLFSEQGHKSRIVFAKFGKAKVTILECCGCRPQVFENFMKSVEVWGNNP